MLWLRLSFDPWKLKLPKSAMIGTLMKKNKKTDRMMFVAQKWGSSLIGFEWGRRDLYQSTGKQSHVYKFPGC